MLRKPSCLSLPVSAQNVILYNHVIQRDFLLSTEGKVASFGEGRKMPVAASYPSSSKSPRHIKAP